MQGDDTQPCLRRGLTVAHSRHSIFRIQTWPHPFQKHSKVGKLSFLSLSLSGHNHHGHIGMWI